MTHGSLFSGIGGFDLAARWCGWTNVFQCEIDPFCRRVLQYHFPMVKLYEDIKKTDFTKHRGAIDVISGGFPCQPFSTAGKRKGTEDNRFLWPEMLRIIREVQPAWVVAENVSGLLTQQRGLVFERVCADLEGEGYEVQPFIIPACAVGAPHRMDRVWIIAHSNWNDAGRCGLGQAGSPHGKTESQRPFAGDSPAFGAGAKRTASDANGKLQERRLCNGQGNGIESFHLSKIKQFKTSGSTEFSRLSRIKTAAHTTDSKRLQNDKGKPSGQLEQNIPDWRDFPTQSPVCRRDDGLSRRLAGITFPKWRSESIKAFGNAIVPQVAYEIFKTIDKL